MFVYCTVALNTITFEKYKHIILSSIVYHRV